MSQQLSHETITQINVNTMIIQGGTKIAQKQKKNNTTRSGISEITGIKLMWTTTAGCAALLVTKIIIGKNQRGVTQWEAVRGTKIGRRKNDGVGRSKKR